jgi:hypothetical protein
MKSTLLMRIQGMEQEVCQLFFATFCRKTDGKWQCVAVLASKVAKKSHWHDCQWLFEGLGD